MGTDRTARICCGLVPHLQLALHPELHGRPVVVAAWRETVVCASPEAAQAGVRDGMGQRQAQQLCPDAEFLEPDFEGAARLADRISAALYDLSPVVEVRIEGVAWIELAGVVQRTLAVREMRRRLRAATGVEPRLGLGPGPFSARLAAGSARPGRLLVVESAREFLHPLPVAELGLEPWQTERLELLGLRRLGDVARLGPRQLESQLGREGRLAARRAAGEEPDLLRAWLPPHSTAVHRQFEPALEDREALLFVGRALCSDLAAEMGLRGAGARRVRLRLNQVERESVVRSPLTSTTELFGLISAWLREWQATEAISEMEIELPVLEAAGRRQLRLWVRDDGSADEVKAALERLQERHGLEIALHPQPALAGSPIPSQRFRWEPVGVTPSKAGPAADPGRGAPGNHSGPELSRNLGDFDCSPRVAKIARVTPLNRTAAAVTLHADDLHGIKASRRR